MSRLYLLLCVANAAVVLIMNIRNWSTPTPEPPKQRVARKVLTVVFWTFIILGALFFFIASLDDILGLLG